MPDRTDHQRTGRSQRTFQSFASRNFRLFFTGQVISASGTWMQRVGQAWLVLELTGSGALLGVVAAAQNIPILLLSLWGGVLADGLDKRRLLIVTQLASSMLALTLFVLTAVDVVEIWMVIILALLLGATDAIDRPARLAYVGETVKSEHLLNAVSLNTVVMNAAKAIGPSIAGVLIATVGVAATFLVNSVSFLAVVVCLLLARPDPLRAPARRLGERENLRSGIREVRRTPGLIGPLLLMAVVGTVAYEWQVTLPLFARDSFDGGAAAFGLMFSALGVGAVVGGLLAAAMETVTARGLLQSTVVFGAAVVGLSTMPVLALALVALLAVGAFSSVLRAQAATLVQLNSRPQLRGRSMALLTIAFAGTTTVGGPLVGVAVEAIGARATIASAGAISMLAAMATARYLARRGAGASLLRTSESAPGAYGDEGSPRRFPPIDLGEM